MGLSFETLSAAAFPQRRELSGVLTLIRTVGPRDAGDIDEGVDGKLEIPPQQVGCMGWVIPAAAAASL
ncbi:hypothetical protein MASR2M79_15470 [Aminivibrio sp.]